MRRTMVSGRLDERALRRNLLLDLVAAAGVGVGIALVGGLLPSVARKAGLDPIALAALAAAPFLANLLGAFAGRVGPRSTLALCGMRALGCALLGILVVGPSPAVVVLAAAGYWLSLSFSSPFHLRLWGSIYPAHLRGRVVGAVGTGRAGASAVAVLAAGIAADRLGGNVVVALGGAVGALCARAYLGMRVPSTTSAPLFTPRQAVAALVSRPVLRRLALAQGFYGGGLIAAAPLYALVFVDRLDLSLTDVGVVGILGATATMVSYYAWGAAADRRGALAVMRAGSILGLASLVGFALAPSVAVLWPAAIAAGVAAAAIDLGIAATVSEQTTMDDRAAAMAGWNTLTGARGLVAPFVASGLVQSGLLDVGAALLVCAAATGVGVVLYVAAGRSARSAPAAERGAEGRLPHAPVPGPA